MKTSFTILIICIFSRQLSYAQTYSSEISDSEIYNFLDWLSCSEKKHDKEPKLKPKHVSFIIRPWSAEFLSQADPTTHEFESTRYLFKEKVADSIFTGKEKEYLIKQFSAIKDTVWHQAFDGSVLKGEYKEGEKSRINYYSVPLFSSDKNHVIISRLYYGGAFLLQSGFYIYKRIDKNKWEFVKKIY